MLGVRLCGKRGLSLSDKPCCDDQCLKPVSMESNGDGTAEITARCASCKAEYTLHRAYPKSVSFDVEHDNESDLPMGASENKLIGVMTFQPAAEHVELTVETEGLDEYAFHRWVIEARDDIVKGKS